MELSKDLLKELQRLARPDLPTQEIDKNQFYWSSAWRKLSRRIKQRDNNECQVCKSQGKVTLGSNKKNGKILIVHHIKPIEFYPSLRLDEDNLLTVCIDCHNAIHFTSSESIEWDDEWW
ncbi:HNH endonuclease [Facklamia sp. P12950]|uniref:HNH endonuclease n=1 Tax=Facklamia sp. P12950 TaxID=3421951 RepID=UPI003D17E362